MQAIDMRMYQTKAIGTANAGPYASEGQTDERGYANLPV